MNVEAIPHFVHSLPSPLVPMLVVFDFDWSLINENSDTYIFERLDRSHTLLKSIRAYMQEPLDGNREPSWTECMDMHVRAMNIDVTFCIFTY